MATPIARFQDQGGRLDTSGIDFEAFRRDPLDANALRCLEYMHDIEYHTPLYMRQLLMTPQAWQDPEFTAFLTIWNYEEYWHGDAIGRVLEAHDRPAHGPRIAAMRRAKRHSIDTSALAFWVLGHVVRHFDAVHMTWGAVNEWTAHAAYGRLAEIAEHPVLDELLTRIMRQEARHAGFYASHARDLLGASVRARRLTRWVLRHRWDIVGSGDVPRRETAFVGAYLFGAGSGSPFVDRIEHRIDALPGLGGLGLVGSAIERCIAEAGGDASVARVGAGTQPDRGRGGVRSTPDVWHSAGV
ncbi:MAG TPA: ferritin-like domain-containing protein [Acidimicrobiia bacterium]